MFSTVLCCCTLAPTAPQATPLGLRKSTCGSMTTRAVRARSSSMVDGGSIGFAGSAYLSPAVAGAAFADVVTAAVASAAATAAPLVRKLRLPLTPVTPGFAAESEDMVFSVQG